MFPFIPLYFRYFSCRLIYESKAENAAVEFTHLQALQTHFGPLKQIMKLLAAIQESFMYLCLNKKTNNDRCKDIYAQVKKFVSFLILLIWHYHFILHLISLLTWDSNLLRFLTISSMLGLPLTHLVILEVVIHTLHALVILLIKQNDLFYIK